MSLGLNPTGAPADVATAGAAFPTSALLMSLLPMLLGPAFSAIDPARRREQLIARTASPETLSALHDMLLKKIMASPVYANALRGVMAGGAGSERMIRSGLARTGVSSSGVGAVAPGLAHMAVSTARGDLAGRADSLAFSQAGDLQQRMIGARMGAPLPTNYVANLFSGGLNAFGPLLGDYFRKRYDLPAAVR